MATWGALTLALQPLISLLAASGTFTSSINNGLFTQLNVDPTDATRLIQACDTRDKILPTARLLALSTGEVLVKFFRPILDPSNESLNLQGLHFLCGMMAGWILLLMESYRRGPRKDPSKRLAAFFFLLGEFYGVGVVMPWWCLLNVLFSYTSFTNARKSNSLSIDPRDLAILPWSLLIGGGIPTLLLRIAPVDHPVAIFTQDFWIIGRLFHSILTIAVHRLLRLFLSSPPTTQKPTPKAQNATSARRTRRLYSIAFWLCTLPHLYTVGSILFAHFQPHQLSAANVEKLQIGNVWPAYSPAHDWTSERIGSIPIGVGAFLLWDEVAYSLAVLLWAVVVNQVGLGRRFGLGSLGVVVKSLGLAVLLGPSSAAVLLLQERDEKVQ